MTAGRHPGDLIHALDGIERRVDVIHRESTCIEFLTKTNWWIEIMELPDGWRVRAYRAGSVCECVAPSVPEAMDAARDVARES
jgi:hypothetical protein